MDFDTEQILAIMDGCAQQFTFPMLDNGYVYLAATRLSLHRSPQDWAMVIEVFGYSPRSGIPDVAIYTFASNLCNRDIPKSYGPVEISNLLANNPNNDFRPVYPIDEGDWHDEHFLVSDGAKEIIVRGQRLPLPAIQEYDQHGITLEEAPRVQVFELCRYLADVERDMVLTTPEERRISVLPSMRQILQLEEWCHPDLIRDEVPSGSETFRQLAEVLAAGNADLYRPTRAPNTHWRNWPDGGTL
jgi:hypothetical protein